MICDVCGVDAKTEGGACTYCPGHLARWAAETSESPVDDSVTPEVELTLGEASIAEAVDARLSSTKPKGKGKK